MEKTLNSFIEGDKISKRKTRLSINLKKALPFYWLLLPSLLSLIVFNYFPMYGIIIAFKNFSPFRGIMQSPWAGFAHFKFFLTSNDFWRVMFNTIRINILALIFGFPAPIILALLLNEVFNKRFKKAVQTISYLPYFVSWVVVAGLVRSVLSPDGGLVNLILYNIFKTQPIHFLAEPNPFIAIVIISDIWKGVGISSIYYIAAISNINPLMYESAIIDGANRWKQTWYITLPGIKTMITILLVLNIGNIVTIGFEKIFLLYNPLVYSVGDVISTYTYRLGLEQQQFSLTTAIGLSQSVVNFIMVFSANTIVKRISKWSMW